MAVFWLLSVLYLPTLYLRPWPSVFCWWQTCHFFSPLPLYFFPIPFYTKGAALQAGWNQPFLIPQVSDCEKWKFGNKIVHYQLTSTELLLGFIVSLCFHVPLLFISFWMQIGEHSGQSLCPGETTSKNWNIQKK